MTPLCFVDTETDGVHPGRRVWEVAVIRRDDTSQTIFRAYIEIDLSTADLSGLRIGGFYERHPFGKYLAGVAGKAPVVQSDLDQPPLASWGLYVDHKTAAHAVARLTHGAHIVGAVPNFDTEMLGNLLREHKLTPAWHYHLIDVEALAVGFVRGNDKRHGHVAGHPGGWADIGVTLPWDSEELSRTCGVEPASEEERHTALGDARHAMRLYDAITGEAA